MTIELQLTIAQANATIFNLYSNVDGFVSPFETNILVGDLVVPYLTNLVPDFTTIVRVQNVGGVCSNFIDIVLQTTTTTTTTSTTSSTTTTTTTRVPKVDCNETATPGGAGVTEVIVNLSPLGGIIIMDLAARNIPDKLELIHNAVKVATSGMTVSNAGPFDDIYGDPTVPDTSQTVATDQFIGSQKGLINDRSSEFLSDTGITNIIHTGQQLIWWKYLPNDYLVNSELVVRVTGPAGTVWNAKRLCEEATTTTSTTSSSTTTTTTTTLSPLVDCQIVTVKIDSVDAEDSDDGTVVLSYKDCNRLQATIPFADAGTYVNIICVDFNSAYSLEYGKGGIQKNAGNSGVIPNGPCIPETTTTSSSTTSSTTSTTSSTTTTTTTIAPDPNVGPFKYNMIERICDECNETGVSGTISNDVPLTPGLYYRDADTGNIYYIVERLFEPAGPIIKTILTESGNPDCQLFACF